MINNRILLMIVVAMIPFVVISFSFKNRETNFNLEENTFVADQEETSSTENEPEKVYTVRIKIDGNVEEMPLEDYIVGVVAGEMPASFDIEALKAQAVASRTYALYKKNVGNLEYDLTDDTSSQVYISLEDMKAKWGTDFEKYYNKILEAVSETDSEVITYEGSIIEAFYFSMSSGNTQDATYVFNESRDYLTSVESVFDNDQLKNYEVQKEVGIDEFKSALGLTCDDVVVDFIESNDAGYTNYISICGKKISGTAFRSALNLRSTNFDIELNDVIKITTRGYGHGVGMSQYGANGYANAGYTYKDILKHYYTGVEIVNLKDV